MRRTMTAASAFYYYDEGLLTKEELFTHLLDDLGEDAHRMLEEHRLLEVFSPWLETVANKQSVVFRGAKPIQVSDSVVAAAWRWLDAYDDCKLCWSRDETCWHRPE